MSGEVTRSRPYMRDAVVEDCYLLANNMRKEDVEEIRHSSGSTPLDALLIGFRMSSRCWTIVWGDEVVAMFGVTPVPKKPRCGAPWLLASDNLKDIRKPFLRHARRALEMVHSLFPVLVNCVWVRNTVHIQWLKWMGFQFLESIQMGEDKEAFIIFYRKEDV